MREKACVIEVIDEDKQRADIRQRQKIKWERRSIYKLPSCVTDLNKNAYKPRAVSFGPYHHDDPNLKPLEDHKQRALLHVLERSKKSLQDYSNALNDVVQDLKDAYDSLDHKWLQNDDQFLQLMIRDGCFMLEILRTFAQKENEDGGYADNDPIFSNHGKLYMMPYMRRDMLMLENQLPLLVLDKLLAVENPEIQDEEFINRLVFKFCFPKFLDEDIEKMRFGKCLHVLHVYRKGLLLEIDSTSQAAGAEHRSRTKTPSGDNASPFKKMGTSSAADGINFRSREIIRPATEPQAAGNPMKKNKTTSLKDNIRACGNCVKSGGDDGNDEIIRSATELREAGIRFKTSKTASLKDISFKGGILSLPRIAVDDTTEPMFLNLIAFERFHVGAGNEVTAYIFFMDNIIDSARDVVLLHSCGIIQNAIGSDKAAAQLFNSLSIDVTLDEDDNLNAVHEKVNQHCRKCWPRNRASLSHTYCQSPWATASVIAAIFLFALTIVQTIYSVGQYYQK